MTKAASRWIFGYGSLMWDPGFPFVEREAALLHGYHRAFCIYSHRYRGTSAKPGLVLGLQPGGSCRGIAYRIEEAQREAVFAYLHKREMDNKVYDQRLVPIRLTDGREVDAFAHITVRDHPQYTGRLSIEQVAALICQGYGERGACSDYLANTVSHLDELGIKDGPMHELLRFVETRRGK